MVKNEIKSRVAPHTSDKEIEILWISIRRENEKPLYCGVYYGKQESSVSKLEIEYEMDLLLEEITERQTEGDILLCMDGNGRIGLMGETVSRNGSLLLNVFEEADLIIMNQSEKCTGVITRQNTRNHLEKSAIDFVVCTPTVEQAIDSILIDEEGLYRTKGCAESDHNSIIIDLNAMNVPNQIKRSTSWRLKDPNEKWEAFRTKMGEIDFSFISENNTMTEASTVA